MSDVSTRDWLLSDRPASRRQARLGQAYRTWSQLRRNRLAMVGLGIVVVLILMAIFANVISPYDPIRGGDLRTERLLPPSWAHLMGTDDQARDIFSRIVHGSRLTLMVVALVAIIATPIGLAVGTTAGYFGGWVDVVLMRITDIFLAFPRLILALAFVAALGPGIENAIIAIAITSWPPYARLARAETLQIRDARSALPCQRAILVTSLRAISPSRWACRLASWLLRPIRTTSCIAHWNPALIPKTA